MTAILCSPRRGAAAVLVACGFWPAVLPPVRSPAGEGAAAAKAPDLAAESLEEPQLLSPTLGRPAFVGPGESLTVIGHIPRNDKAPEFELVTTAFPPHRHPLASPDDAGAALAAGKPVTLRVPLDVPTRTYDLEIRCGDVQLTGRHCVAVGRVPQRVRLVHLSNMNIGDAGAPDFDRRLIEEVNLVGPTLIVATGDFLDATCDDLEGGWQRLVEFVTRFDAPVVMACGDHDDFNLYSRFVAPSPVGTIAVGGLRGVVLFDVPAHPITADAALMQWVERALTAPGQVCPTFIVSHDESPNLLRAWQQRGALAEMIKATQLGLWFAGGHRDWDGTEYRALIEAAAPMTYLGTHESSTAARDGATGVSHYRIVDVAENRAWLPGADAIGNAVPPSIAVGRLNAWFDGPNDGSCEQVGLTVVNNLPYRLDGLSATVVLKRSDAGVPWCVGAELERATEVGPYWEARVRFGLPDKGALHAVVGTGPQPTSPNVEAWFDAPPRLALTREMNDEGVAFLAAAQTPILVHLRNRGAEPAEVAPVMRLDGAPVGYLVLDEPGPVAAAYRLRLAPGKTLTLQVDLSTIRVAPGRRELQVYVKGPAAWWPACHPFDLTVAGATTVGPGVSARAASAP